MTGATHMFVAATVYSFAKNKPVGLALAFGSHFLLDAIPHYELSLTLNYLFAIATGFFLCFAAWRRRDGFILLAAFLGVLPDINRIFGLSQGLNKVHNFFHFKGLRVSVEFFLSEVIISFVAGLLFLKKINRAPQHRRG